MSLIGSLSGINTNGASLRKKNQQEGNQNAHVAYASIPNIGALLNGSQNQTQTTASGIRA